MSVAKANHDEIIQCAKEVSQKYSFPLPSDNHISVYLDQLYFQKLTEELVSAVKQTCYYERAAGNFLSPKDFAVSVLTKGTATNATGYIASGLGGGALGAIIGMRLGGFKLGLILTLGLAAGAMYFYHRSAQAMNP